MSQHICIISQRYPCKETPTLHVFVQKIAWAMRDQGAKVTIVSPVPVNQKEYKTTPEYYIEKTELDHEIEVYRPRYLYLGMKGKDGIGTIRLSEALFYQSCKKTVERMKSLPDVFYGHFVVMAGICACRLGRTFNKSAFIAYGESTDETLHHYGLKGVRYELKNVNGIIAVSTKNKNSLIQNHVVAEDKIRVFVNGVNTTLFYKRDKAESRKRFRLEDKDFVVAFVGQFTERKGLNIVDEAVREIGDIKALYAGKGVLNPEGDYIVHKGPLEQKDIPYLLSAADLFVFPSRFEGCSNALLEAMACGLPIIASDMDFNYDILDKNNAILVDGLSVAQVREAILALRGDPIRMDNMSKCSQERVKQLSIEHRAANILNWIQNI